jgi:hypothetical protein
MQVTQSYQLKFQFHSPEHSPPPGPKLSQRAAGPRVMMGEGVRSWINSVPKSLDFPPHLHCRPDPQNTRSSHRAASRPCPKS